MSVPTIIRSARERAGYTQLQLAEMLGVGQAAVSHWERGANLPTLSQRVTLAELLSIPVEQLIPEVGASQGPDREELQRLVSAFSRLSAERRAFFIELIEALVERCAPAPAQARP